MADNVFKFRRLKWGDPEQKLQMTESDAARQGALSWIDLALCAAITASIAVIIWHLL